MGYYCHKPITESIDISVLRSMREQGYTNKQIANSCGISVSTVYKYIGKRSMDVRKAAEQNKPCPVKSFDIPQVEPVVEEPEEPIIEQKVEEKPLSTLKIVKEVRILDIDGILCSYHVDTRNGDVSFGGGIITGELDKLSIQTFIDELTEIKKMISVEVK